ncbi:MAG: hypothetical protein PHS46_02465 [Candidatus Omnitrophica bacterium]|nr:hypothetical protein [Candidatus Omnitrophota bacterium]
MIPYDSWINKKRFGRFTLLLSPVYFITATYQVSMYIISAEIRKYGISLLVFPFALFLVLVGVVRVYLSYLLLRNACEEWMIKLIFVFLCAIEIFFGFFAGLILIAELGLIGNIIVMLFVIYYVYALLFFRNKIEN